MQLSDEQVKRLAAAPAGHLSTASKSGVPHVIPVCFALAHREDGPVIYIVLDQKPKRAALTRLRRVRNILANPRVALVVDHYDDDWTQLWYILITGTAQLLEGERSTAYPEPVEGSPAAGAAHPEPVEGSPASDEITHAIRLLRDKYPQYRDMDIDGNPVIKITPGRVVSWSSSQ